MEIGITLTPAPSSQLKIDLEGKTKAPVAEQDSKTLDQTQIAESKNSTQSNASKEASLAISSVNTTKSPSQPTNEQLADTASNNTKANSQFTIELATSAFEKRQAEKSESRTLEQQQLRDKFSSDATQEPARILDINA